jgi:alpha-1,6-mannosyltransferase
MLLISLFKSRISLSKVIFHGVLASVFFISLSVLVDSYFWGKLLWPEGQVLYFNTILNKSHEWGTLPFWWYFYSAIPRAMFLSLFLIPCALFNDRKKLFNYLLLPAVGFVLIYSFLPHKELRFIIYVLPLLNCVAAKGLDDL